MVAQTHQLVAVARADRALAELAANPQVEREEQLVTRLELAARAERRERADKVAPEAQAAVPQELEGAVAR